MKKIVIVFNLISLLIGCNAQTENQMNKTVVDILKQNKLNLEIFELSFCLNEILYIIENDSNYYKIWEDRINESFHSKIKE